MSLRSYECPQSFPRVPSPQPSRPGLEVVKQKPVPASLNALRAAFWGVCILLAIGQAWISHYQVSADSISYLDMSDGVLPGSDWHRLINGVWSPLYPAILGVFRRVFNISPQHEIVAGHLLNIVFFLFSFSCFFLSQVIGTWFYFLFFFGFRLSVLLLLRFTLVGVRV